MEIGKPSTIASHSTLMDAVYRKQRHVYDLTRKFFLLGRDHMIEQLDCRANATILEVACGTGRNLVVAGSRYPTSRLYGLDISTEMLKTARANIGNSAQASRFALAEGDATSFDSKTLFGIDGFDRVFLSYAVSMIPSWETAVAEALAAVKPGGQLHIVDFGQQSRLPRWFRSALHGWIAKFHVTPRANFETVIADISAANGGRHQFTSLYRDFARYCVIFKPAD